MERSELLEDLRAKVSAQVDLLSEGLGRYRVLTPFQFDDGDHIAVVLRRDGSAWELSDEGHTLMHLTYSIDEADLHRGSRRRIIDDALSGFRMEDRAGELVLRVPDEQYRDALFSFVQGILRISDVSYLSREHARSTFLEDFRGILIEAVPSDRLTFDWHDIRDPQGNYAADARIDRDSGVPRTVFALPNDARVRDATITLLQLEKWGLSHEAVAIFSDQESINRKVLARFSDVCDKQFSSLWLNRDRIHRYLSSPSG